MGNTIKIPQYNFKLDFKQKEISVNELFSDNKVKIFLK